MSEPSTGPIPVNPQGPLPPEAPIDQTVRLQAGEPVPPEALETAKAPSSLGTHPFPVGAPTEDPTRTVTMGQLPELPPSPTASSTQDMPALFPDPTQTVTQSPLPEVPLAVAPAPPAPIPLKPKGSGRMKLILGVVIAVIVIAALVGVFGYRAGWFGGERPAPPSYAGDERNGGTARPKPVVTPAIQPYIERAEAGDATAMQMLGYFYYYGLNVPQSRDEGLRWYRKAAAAGSVSAQKELAALEGKAEPK